MARIMVVDDAAFMRTMLKNMLTEFGHEVVAEAVDGDEAVRKYKQVKPDLVTMDITMPEKDGLIALQEIKAFDAEAIVIMCSAMGQQKMVVDAIRSGAKDFLVKPFHKDRVQEAVSKQLKLAQIF
ncbi:response regulator [Paenibacillus cremeus]|uniref:Response regulator n=1 Tax=Paenibacillus cremeus TaxID=2163881 RepID=A0A559K8R1_9BACL|nr:response regulator [Paenibacillus cremeus]TVY08508.1 response regulator [Paenibacillus cremeus]